MLSLFFKNERLKDKVEKIGWEKIKKKEEYIYRIPIAHMIKVATRASHSRVIGATHTRSTWSRSVAAKTHAFHGHTWWAIVRIWRSAWTRHAFCLLLHVGRLLHLLLLHPVGRISIVRVFGRILLKRCRKKNKPTTYNFAR